uniref:Uncharacterized protein K02A2.6 n=1 Tax=Schistocephalus solidus TaxID=70667 RepID=A0A0V0J533_SCHSO
MYNSGKKPWVEGIVRKSKGVVFEVETATGIVKRHANQLRRRFTTDGQIALDLLCDTFEVPTPEGDTKPISPPVRQSHRKTQPPKKVIVDPKKKRYEVHLSKAGGVTETGAAVESWPKAEMARVDARRNRPSRLRKMRRQPGNQSVCAAAPSTRQASSHACGPNPRSFRQGFSSVRSD